MNAHMKPDASVAGLTTSASDHFEMEVCDHYRKARATSIIAGKIKSDFSFFASSPHQIPAKNMIDLTKSDVDLLLDYIDDLVNEARCLRERFYEVVE
jgi:Holliday junction resolvase RusA-like endonuclease